MTKQQKQEPSTHKRVRIRDIRPNPFRHLERYPLHADKVETLRASIRKTGWWKNVVGRKGSNGTVELAYGHHRLEALKLEYGPDDEVGLIVEDLDDTTMLQIMANENMEEFSSSAWIEMETVRAVVEAYAERKIQLDAPRPQTSKNQLRSAPSYVMGNAGAARARIYTAESVATFLGWLGKDGGASDRVKYALAALELIEQKHLRHRDFEGLNHTRMREVVRQTKASVKKTEALAEARRKKAEDARKRAEEAEKKKQEARKRQLKREAEIKASRNTAERKQKEEEVRKLEQEQIRAEQERLMAEKVVEVREAEAEKIEKKRADTAARVGRTVAHKLRTGKIKTKDASKERLKIDRWKKDEKVQYAEDVMSKLCTDLARTMNPAHDKTAKKIKEAIRLSREGAISDREMEKLARGLDGLAERAAAYARTLREPKDQVPRRSDVVYGREPEGKWITVVTEVIRESERPPIVLRVSGDADE
ncbi:ParB N-terminal domain-containing protein [Gemmatimonadota bacterium]